MRAEYIDRPLSIAHDISLPSSILCHSFLVNRCIRNNSITDLEGSCIWTNRNYYSRNGAAKNERIRNCNISVTSDSRVEWLDRDGLILQKGHWSVRN
jgi:hypothetical protein